MISLLIILRDEFENRRAEIRSPPISSHTRLIYCAVTGLPFGGHLKSEQITYLCLVTDVRYSQLGLLVMAG